MNRTGFGNNLSNNGNVENSNNDVGVGVENLDRYFTTPPSFDTPSKFS